MAGLAGLVVVAASVAWYAHPAPQRNLEISSQSRKGFARYLPTPAEWAGLTIEPVSARSFRAEHVTEGKIAVDEDRATPVFSPYAGRIIKLLAEAGAGPQHIVRLTWYLTSRDEYEAAGAGIGAAWRETLGKNFPPSTLLYITGLVDERAKVEIEVTAFVPGA